MLSVGLRAGADRSCELKMAENTIPDERPRVQLHLVLPYKADPIEHNRVRAYLDRGYRIEQLQRITDREAIVTLGRVEPSVP